MPRNKKKNEPEPRHPIEDAPATEQHNMMKDIIEKVMFHIKRQNESHQLVADLQKKIGKNSAVQMSKKEKEKAVVVYEKHLRDLVESQKFVQAHLSMMKQWREHAVDHARDTSALNAIELLRLRVGCLPIWDPDAEPNGEGAGGISFADDKRPQKGNEVAAFVEETKTWILAQVIGPIANHRYECVDVDDRDRKVAVFARKQLILLPHQTVHYRRHPNMAFPANAIVLAIYPGTTCFYEGIVHRIPQMASDSYLIRFVDNQRPDKYSDPLAVSDRYVIAYKKDPVVYIRPAKRIELGLEPHKVEKKKRSNSNKKEKKAGNEPNVVDDKDVPGPAPPPPPPDFMHVMEPTRRRGKSTDKKRSKSSDKPKIIRARVPPHKKIRSTRQFGKRRIKRKPKDNLPTTSEAGEQPSKEQKDGIVPKVGNEKKGRKSREEMSDSEEELTGHARFGLEDEAIETDSEDDARRRKRAAPVLKKKKAEDEPVVGRKKEEKEEEKEAKVDNKTREDYLDESDEDASDAEEVKEDEKMEVEQEKDEKEEEEEDSEDESDESDDDGSDDSDDSDDSDSSDGDDEDDDDDGGDENDAKDEEGEQEEKVTELRKAEEVEVKKIEEEVTSEEKNDEKKEKNDEKESTNVDKEEDEKEKTNVDKEEETKDEPVQPHDPEKGTSSGPSRYNYNLDSDNEYGPIRRRSSSSDSSDDQSGISVSDNERNRKGFDSDDEEKK